MAMKIESGHSGPDPVSPHQVTIVVDGLAYPQCGNAARLAMAMAWEEGLVERFNQAEYVKLEANAKPGKLNVNVVESFAPVSYEVPSPTV